MDDDDDDDDDEDDDATAADDEEDDDDEEEVDIIVIPIISSPLTVDACRSNSAHRATRLTKQSTSRWIMPARRAGARAGARAEARAGGKVVFPSFVTPSTLFRDAWSKPTPTPTLTPLISFLPLSWLSWMVVWVVGREANTHFPPSMTSRN